MRSKRITKQVQLNILINEVEFENTFLVVKGLSLDVILGNDFLERNGAVIDFNKQIVKFEKGNKPVRIEFKKVVNEAKVTGIKMLHKQIGDREIETKINICLESDSLENEEGEMYESNESVWALSLIHILTH